MKLTDQQIIDAQFVSEEMAYELFDLGFREQCLRTTHPSKTCASKVNGSCPLPNVHCQYPRCEEDDSVKKVGIPLWQQVMEWLRIKHDMHIEFIHAGKPNFYHVFIKDYIYDVFDKHNPKSFEYTEARTAAINKALKKVHETILQDN